MRAYLIPLLCAIVWIGVAMLVAYPQHVYAYDVISLSKDFMSGDKLSRVFIPLLIFVDILIALFVGHYRTSQTRFLIIVVTVVLYVIFAITPEVATAISPEKTVSIFMILMILLLTIRSVSFYSEDRRSTNFVEIDT